MASPKRREIDITPGSLIRTRGPAVLGNDVISLRWCNRTCVYLGPDIIDRYDGVKIINHLLLIDGEEKLVDRRILYGATVL